MKTRSACLMLFLAAALIPAAQADLDVSVIAEIRLGKSAPPPPPEVIVPEAMQSKKKGPPPWAPAHGARKKHAYYYYPGGNAYYRPADRTWFYLEGRDWRAGVSLPASVKIDFGRSVSLEMGTDRPYEHHKNVVEQYPADYFSKVKIKGGKDKSSGQPARSVNPSSETGHPGDKGKGKGKGKDK